MRHYTSLGFLRVNLIPKDFDKILQPLFAGCCTMFVEPESTAKDKPGQTRRSPLQLLWVPRLLAGWL